MIRYPTTKAELESAVEAHKSGWLNRAKARTERFRTLKKYDEAGSIWSEVRAVYAALQSNKCAYCERKLEAGELSGFDQDVEHFRPKGAITKWIPPTGSKLATLPMTEPTSDTEGYYLLAYCLWNYSIACKPCNQALKGDAFPIRGQFDITQDAPTKLTTEEPYLIYPVGEIDEDPELLIRFNGTSPCPVVRNGHRRHRALVTIEFFRLDQRTTLLDERAMVISLLFTHLERLSGTPTPSQKAKSEKMLATLQSNSARHANCARNFVGLYKTQVAKARTIHNAVEEYLASGS